MFREGSPKPDWVEAGRKGQTGYMTLVAEKVAKQIVAQVNEGKSGGLIRLYYLMPIVSKK